MSWDLVLLHGGQVEQRLASELVTDLCISQILSDLMSGSWYACFYFCFTVMLRTFPILWQLNVDSPGLWPTTVLRKPWLLRYTVATWTWTQHINPYIASYINPCIDSYINPYIDSYIDSYIDPYWAQGPGPYWAHLGDSFDEVIGFIYVFVNKCHV